MQNLIEEPQTTVIYKFIVKLKHNEGKDTEFLCCDKKFDLAGDVEGVNFELRSVNCLYLNLRYTTQSQQSLECAPD